ncbi:MAG: CocE/NonD family hydrolase [Hyphomicrobiales bacterium]
MTVVQRFPAAVEMLDDVMIPMPDGVKLAARIWRPVTALETPVPAIFEFIPYRRRDGTVDRDMLTHPYFAGHGYACVRVDIRGSGDSEGVLKGEYLPREQDDAIAILKWLEEQPWCTGKVGMIGISWGGFNGLQVAARRPKQLKAVVSICSTDDRYADDIHFMGGALLLDKMSWWTTMFSLNACPPDPAIVGDKWKAMWLKRIDESGFWLEDWLTHQRRDAFYKHGSVCEDWSAIETPVLAVGGWADGYSNTIFRLLQNLKGPKKGLVGPWAHKYPHFAKPGPQIGFLQECLRWFDKWLKDVETGVMDEPMLAAYVEDPVRPAGYNAEKPGRWVAEAQWPPKTVKNRKFGFSQGRLGRASEDVLTVGSPQTTGLAGGKWCPYGNWADQALDQRQETGGQIVFETPPLKEALDVLGAPVATLEVASDKPNAFVAVTLCEVFPDGAATRISYGVLNLTHRNGHEDLKPIKPGRRYKVQVKLNDLGHRFGVGNRIRVAVSNAYWPTVWPSPEANLLKLYCKGSSFGLPVRAASPLDRKLPPFPPAESSAPFETVQLQPASNTWTVSENVMTGETVLERVNDDGYRRLPSIDLEQGTRAAFRYTIKAADPLSATFASHVARRYKRGDWDLSIDTKMEMTSTLTHFLVEAVLEAKEASEVVRRRTFSLKIPRDHV